VGLVDKIWTPLIVSALRSVPQTAMAKSTFWKSAAEKFRTLDPERKMCANWESSSQDPANIQWQITGVNSVEDRTQFRRLATVAGKQLDRLSTNGARTWLNKLKETIPSRAEHRTVTTDKDGNEQFIDLGTIAGVCQASKNLCDELELEAQVSESLGSYTPEAQIQSKGRLSNCSCECVGASYNAGSH
jgi:hypothetical protein